MINNRTTNEVRSFISSVLRAAVKDSVLAGVTPMVKLLKHLDRSAQPNDANRLHLSRLAILGTKIHIQLSEAEYPTRRQQRVLSLDASQRIALRIGKEIDSG